MKLKNKLQNCIKLISAGVLVATSFASFAVASSLDTPLTTDANTIGLWNFDNDTGDTVVDSSSNPLNGTAFSAAIVGSGIPGLSPVFGSARQFNNGFVDFGEATSTKFDLTGATALSVEAYISATSTLNGMHMIFDNAQVQLLLFGDKPAAFVMQPSGFRGVIADDSIPLNTPVRLSLVLANGRLALLVNERVAGGVAMPDPVGPRAFSTAHTFVGGNVLSQFFNGYIDDVRVSDTPRFDIAPPTVTLVSPVPSVPVSIARPQFEFTWTDTGTASQVSGIDLASARIYLNGTLQTGLAMTATGFSGQLVDPLLAGQANIVRVEIADNIGNVAEREFSITYSSRNPGVEYETDSDTLALWHMNEPEVRNVIDSSGRNANGVTTAATPVDGVFSRGRSFTNGPVVVPAIVIPETELTFEGWFRPAQNPTGPEQVLYTSNQFRVTRFGEGRIRVTLYSVRSPFTAETTQIVLPLAEQHHMAVVWNGSASNENLLIYKDGVIVETFAAPVECEFDNTPASGTLGAEMNVASPYVGMMDEVRISRVARQNFNVPTRFLQTLIFQSLQAGTSTLSSHPELHVQINAANPVNPTDVTVRLNGVVQPAGANLVVTGTSIDGTMTNALQPGLNVIEISVLDDEGNMIRRSTEIFHIANLGGRANVPDADTVALWAFEDPIFNQLRDTSGNGYHLTGTTYRRTSTVNGVIGLGRNLINANRLSTATPAIRLRSRSLTVEGWIRITQTGVGALVARLIGTDFHIQAYVQRGGNSSIHFATPDGTLNPTIGNVFPDDNQFHHVALIYDSSRGFAQTLIAIDGEVKGTYNFRCRCNFNQPLGVNLGADASPNDTIEIDEMRVSKSARYAFNLGVPGTRPVIGNVSPAPESTVHTDSPAVNFEMTGSDPISPTDTYVTVNGVRQTGLIVSTAGLSATVTGNLSGLQFGANQIEVHAVDTSTREQVKGFVVHYIAQGSVAAYASDAQTVGLWHFDETSGSVFADSSTNAADLTQTQPWVMNRPGVFGSTAAGFATGTGSNTQLQAQATLPNVQGLQRFTTEFWYKREATSNTRGMPFWLENLDMFNVDDVTVAYHHYYASGSFDIAAGYQLPSDTNWHHMALILDMQHPLRQSYFVVDGVVQRSNNWDVPTNVAIINDRVMQALRPGWFTNASVDEMRVSSTARYTLSFAQSVVNQQPAELPEPGLIDRIRQRAAKFIQYLGAR